MGGDDELHGRDRGPAAEQTIAAGRGWSWVVNTRAPVGRELARYAEEHKAPLEIGDVRGGLRHSSPLSSGGGEIARHDRRPPRAGGLGGSARRLL